MTIGRRAGGPAPRALGFVWFGIASLAVACGGSQVAPVSPAAGAPVTEDAVTEDAVRKGLAFLFAQQRPADGRIVSDVYGVLRRGDALTAAVLIAAASLPQELRRPHEPAIARAFASFDLPPPAAAADDPVDYPCYALAYRLHALALLQPQDWRVTADRLGEQLGTRQLDEANGWQPDDPEFGGFGLGDGKPQKPLGGQLVGLWTTTAVVEALRAAGRGTDDPLLQRARRFVEHCQRFGGGGDGGFAAAPPGIAFGAKAGTTPASVPISYGTATADGLRALLATGDPATAPRVVAARTWLSRHATAARCPGFPEAAPLGGGLTLYWLAAWSHALAACGEQEPAGLRARLGQFAAPEGSFVNGNGAMKEDDPVVATCLALQALAPWLGGKGGARRR